MTTNLDTELYVVKGKVYEQKKGYSPKTGENIGYEKGAKLVKNHYDQNQDDAIAHFMGREIIEAILAQPGVAGIRMFNGTNEMGLTQPILVGVDSNGDNIITFSTIADNGEIIKNKGIVAGGVRTCPPYCSPSTGLGW